VNTGFSHAVNLGIEQASTKWIAILNNDVSIEPSGWLSFSRKARPRMPGL